MTMSKFPVTRRSNLAAFNSIPKHIGKLALDVQTLQRGTLRGESNVLSPSALLEDAKHLRELATMLEQVSTFYVSP